MALYLRGNVWWVSMWRGGAHIQASTGFRREDKKSARKVELTMKSAEVGRSEIDREIVDKLLHRLYDDRITRTPLEAVWPEYLQVLKVRGGMLVAKSLADKESCFEKFVEWAKKEGVGFLDKIDGNIAQCYALHLERTPNAKGQIPSAKRRKNILDHISNVWSYIMPNHRIAQNPWVKVKPLNIPTNKHPPFSVEQEERIFAVAPTVHRQWFVACKIGRHTGLRFGDICRLTWGQVDFEAMTIYSKPHKTERSSGAEVLNPMPKDLQAVMIQWANENPNRTPYDRVLPFLKEKGPKGDERFSTVLKKAGITDPRYTFHSWRHTTATRLGEAGVSIEIRKNVLGHTTDAMAEHYDQSTKLEERRAALELAAAI